MSHTFRPDIQYLGMTMSNTGTCGVQGLRSQVTNKTQEQSMNLSLIAKVYWQATTVPKYRRMNTNARGWRVEPHHHTLREFTAQ